MMKTQRGNLGCRFCFAAVDDRERAAALAEIAPALDILLSRPADPAHSDYQGLTHKCTISLLTPQASRVYAALFRRFPFPPSWPRVQGG